MLITIEAGDPPVTQSAAKNIDLSVGTGKKAYLSWSLSLKSEGSMPLVGDKVKAFSGERTVFAGEISSFETSSGYIRFSATGVQP